MPIARMLLAELEQEADATRRVLQRVPGDQLGWKPHDKSMSLGQLALHVATVPGAVADACVQEPFRDTSFNRPSAASAAELLPALERSLGQAREALGERDDDWFASTWRFMDGEREMMAVPRGAFLRSVMLNHWYHHRGQLTVYLRQLNVPVPSIYGPSADENPFLPAR